MQMTWAALTHPDDLAGDITHYDRIFAGEVEAYLMAKRWICKNGDVVHTNTSLKCQRRKDGSVDYFAAMVEEVSGLDQSSAGHPATARDTLPDHEVLSRREGEVARLMGLGRTVKEVAAMLALSEKTIGAYRSRVLTKLKLKSTAKLIPYALKNRLAE
jgi:DNA-binding NarL/FixJ family response regulator